MGSVAPAAAIQPMNDVLNAKGFSQAAWWSRISAGAWTLMAAMAASGCVLTGLGAPDASSAAVSIAAIGTPRLASVRVVPQDLIALAQTRRPDKSIVEKSTWYGSSVL